LYHHLGDVELARIRPAGTPNFKEEDGLERAVLF
jgi:hypothetical protein